MFIYSNGDGHVSAAEAANNFLYLEDDYVHRFEGKRPHPQNLKISWGALLSKHVKMPYYTDAEAFCSNERIIRTTREWIERSSDTINDIFFLIEWAPWDREEWNYKDKYFQVGLHGEYSIPSKLLNRYEEYKNNYDEQTHMINSYKAIIEFHQYLLNKNYNHLFINGTAHLDIPKNEQYVFGKYYMEPYNHDCTIRTWADSRGYPTMGRNNYHYGESFHKAYAEYMYSYITGNNIL